MPILSFEIVDKVSQQNLARSLADSAAEILGAKPGTTWVKINFLSNEHYAENGGSSEKVKPVFVSILLGRSDGVKDYSRIAKEMAESFAKILNRPSDNIHVLFEPNAIGRIAFGGKLLTDP